MNNEDYSDWSFEKINQLFDEIFGSDYDKVEIEDPEVDLQVADAAYSLRASKTDIAEQMLNDIGVSVRKGK